MPDLTAILSAIEAGDGRAANDLLPLVYQKLRRLAAAQMTREKPGQTLDATGLVHEAYLRLLHGESREVEWANRRHFFAAAAEAMRRILIENARRKGRIKHGGNLPRVEVHDNPAAEPSVDMVQLDEALTRLAAEDPLAAQIVELRVLCRAWARGGRGHVDNHCLSARQKWAYAKAWLRHALRDE